MGGEKKKKKKLAVYIRLPALCRFPFSYRGLSFVFFFFSLFLLFRSGLFSHTGKGTDSLITADVAIMAFSWIPDSRLSGD